MKSSTERKLKELTRVITPEAIAKLQDLSVTHDGNGYTLFNKYSITKENSLYKVSVASTYTEINFGSLRHAAAWCCLDRRNKVTRANRLIELDQAISSMNASIELFKKLASKAKDIEQYLIYQAKLNEDLDKRRKALDEMDRYIAESDKWQNSRLDAPQR